MQYRLKQTSPEIDVVDGPLAGRKFKHGEVYEEIPEGDKGRFEEVETGDSPDSTTPKGGVRKSGTVPSDKGGTK